MTPVGRGCLNACVILGGGPLLFGACHIDNKHAYHRVVANVPVSGADRVSVAAHDQRPYVISGKKTPEFVGLSRGLYNNPWDVTTEDGRSLAEHTTQALASWPCPGAGDRRAIPRRAPAWYHRALRWRSGSEGRIQLTVGCGAKRCRKAGHKSAIYRTLSLATFRGANEFFCTGSPDRLFAPTPFGCPRETHLGTGIRECHGARASPPASCATGRYITKPERRRRSPPTRMSSGQPVAGGVCPHPRARAGLGPQDDGGGDPPGGPGAGKKPSLRRGSGR
jgi:hypothetical protein